MLFSGLKHDILCGGAVGCRETTTYRNPRQQLRLRSSGKASAALQDERHHFRPQHGFSAVGVARPNRMWLGRFTRASVSDVAK